MQQQRYRISFIAHFDAVIEADSVAEARRKADDMASSLVGIEQHKVRCAWNTIELLSLTATPSASAESAERSDTDI